MAALDFPASPTVGQLYPTPAVPGVPVYKWDGEKWTTLGGALGSTGASDAIPQQNAGTGAAGSSTLWTRGDHAHPATAPTPPPGDNDTSIATTAFVSDAIGTAVGGIPGAPSAVVRYDIAQSLTDPQSAQARKNIYAAPFDAMAYSGMQINGGMEVSQENGAASVSVPTGVKYIVDGWNIASSGAHVLSCTQRVDLNLAGLNSGLQLAVTTANPTPAAADYCTLRQFIEGYRIKRLAWGTAAAQPITLGFWLTASRTGLYSGCVRNGVATRGYIFTFNYTTSGAWQYFTVTIPGDTAGTWTADNSIGLAVHFSIMSGSNNQGAAGAWSSTVQLGATGTVNGVAATSDYFIITGVTVLPGSEVPSAARSPFIMRPYDQELVTCRRYYRKTDGQPGLEPSFYGGYGANAGSSVGYCIPFQVPMRAAPAVAVVSGSISCINSGDSQPRVAAISPLAYTPYVIAAAAGPVQFQSSTCVLSFDARL